MAKLPTLDDNLMLAVGMKPSETVVAGESGDQQSIEAAVKELGQAIFSQVKVSLQSATKAVVPNIPKVIEDLSDEIKKSSSEKFGKVLEKLNRTVNDLGINLRDYNKELANFLEEREANIIERQKESEFYTQQGIVTKIDQKTGELKIVSEKEVRDKTNLLKRIETEILNREKTIKENATIIQTQQNLSKKEINTRQAIIIEQEQKLKLIQPQREELQKELQPLQNRPEPEEKPGIMSRIGEATSNFSQNYIPGPINDVLSTFVGLLKTPFDIIRDFGGTILEFLKPFKLIVKPVLGLFRFFGPYLKLLQAMFALDKLQFALKKLDMLTSPKILAAITAAGVGALATYGFNKVKNSEDTTKDIDMTDPDSMMNDFSDMDEKDLSAKKSSVVEKRRIGNTIIPKNEIKNENFYENTVKGKFNTPIIDPKDFREKTPPKEMMASNSLINAPRTTINQNQHTLSGGLNLRNSDSWYNKSIETA